MTDRKGMIRIFNWLAGTIALFVAILFPLDYYLDIRQFTIGNIEVEAEINSRIISGLINANPKMWQYEQMRLEELLGRRPKSGEKEIRRIVDLQGKVVAESNDGIAPPLITRSYDLKDSGTTVGRLEVSRSMRPHIIGTILYIIFGIFLGLIAFFAVRILPFRAMIRAERSLREANAFLNKIMESTTNAIISIDLEGRINLVNSRCCALSGYTPEELVGQQLSTLFPADEFPGIQEQIYGVIVRDLTTVQFEAKLAGREGLVDISCGVAPFYKDDQIAGLVLTAEDIGERKKSEVKLHEYRKIIESTSDMVCVVSRDYRYLLVNRAFLDYREMAHDDVVGRTLEEILGVDTFVQVKEHVDECLAGKTVRFDMRYDYPGKGMRDLAILYSPIEEDQEIGRLACVVRDITEHRHLEQQKRALLAAELETEKTRLNIVEKEHRHLREKEMLVKDLHDGIGGIVTNIAMLGQFALMQSDAGQCHITLDRIVGLASEGASEIRSFMNSIESGESSWSDLLAEIKGYTERMLEPHAIRVEVSANICERLSPIGPFRYVNIVRICREVTANIIKHSGARSVRLFFLATTEQFELSLVDDGIGYNPDSVKKRGLANMRTRAREIGADITMASSSGGTTVSLVMPLIEQQIQLEEKCI